MSQALRSATSGTKKEKADQIRKADAEYIEAAVAPFFDPQASTTVSLDVVNRLPEQLKPFLSQETKEAMQVAPRYP